MTDPAVTWWIALTNRFRPWQRWDAVANKENGQELGGDETAELAAVTDEEYDEEGDVDDDDGDGETEQSAAGFLPRILMGVRRRRILKLDWFGFWIGSSMEKFAFYWVMAYEYWLYFSSLCLYIYAGCVSVYAREGVG